LDPVAYEKEVKTDRAWRDRVVAAKGEAGLKDVCIMAIEGRMHPVKLRYLAEATPNYLKACVDQVMNIHRTERDRGDILVFLTGQEEVHDVVRAIRDRSHEKAANRGLRLTAVPLFAFLSTREQYHAYAHAQPMERKVVVSTNVAETAVTIQGIRFVVDCCYVKTEAFDVRTGTTHYEVSPASQAALHQRAGRAGRCESGVCYRLITQPDFDRLCPPQSVPEILRSNLCHFVLRLKCLGVDRVAAMDFIVAPPSVAFERALEDLYLLGAIDADARLVEPLGVHMAYAPVSPLWAKLILTAAADGSNSFGCAAEACLIAAMAQVQSPFRQQSAKKERLRAARESLGVFEGDLVSLCNVARQFEECRKQDPGWADRFLINIGVVTRALQVSHQLEAFLESYGYPVGSCGTDVEALRRCICHAWYMQAAKRCNDGSYVPLRNVKGRSYELHPHSMLAGSTTDMAEYIVYEETLSWDGHFYMKNVTKVEVEWLKDAAPNFFKEQQH